MLRQAGVALVSVLLVVAIGTVLAVSMIQEQYASIQISRGYLSRTQANQYALGGEELARQILYADFEKENAFLGTSIPGPPAWDLKAFFTSCAKMDREQTSLFSKLLGGGQRKPAPPPPTTRARVATTTRGAGRTRAATSSSLWPSRSSGAMR